jgi:hypothetical protein
MGMTAASILHASVWQQKSPSAVNTPDMVWDLPAAFFAFMTNPRIDPRFV